MSNPLRIVYDNAADRSTLTASSAAITQANLLTDSKSIVWRSVSAVTSATVSASWTSFEPVSCASFPFCNFSPAATMRVRCYSDTAGTVQIYDSNAVLCCPAPAVKVVGLTAAQAASAYSYAGGAHAVVWWPVQQAKKVVIDIVDTNNLQGYLEASRLVLGDYFSPKYNAEYGASVTYEDQTKNFRSDAGNLLSDVGTRNKKLSANLSFMVPADRAALWKLVRYVGISSPVYISLFPGNADVELEQAHTVYGKFTQMSQISAVNYNIYSSPLEVESI